VFQSKILIIWSSSYQKRKHGGKAILKLFFYEIVIFFQTQLGSVSCVTQECSPLSCVNQILPPGACCPVCRPGESLKH